MERYLLFDSGCSLCTALARQVEEAADGKLTARSLRDPDVRSILDETKPGWRWEPMLLEVDGDRRRVHAGRRMQFRMLRLLGWRRSLDILRVLYQHDVSRVAPDAGRRTFLRRSYGFALSVALLPLLGRFPAPRQTPPTPQGNHPLRRVTFLDAQELTGRALQEALQTALQSPDVRNVLDSMLPNKVFLPAVAGGAGTTAQSESTGPNLANAKAVRHTLDGGNELLAVTWTVGDWLIVYQKLHIPIDGHQEQAFVLTREFGGAYDDLRFRVRHASVDGDIQPEALERQTVTEGDQPDANYMNCSIRSCCDYGCSMLRMCCSGHRCKRWTWWPICLSPPCCQEWDTWYQCFCVPNGAIPNVAGGVSSQ